MATQLFLYNPCIIELAVVVVVLPVTGKRLPSKELQIEAINHNFIPDQRRFTFRLLGKPSLAQSPPFKII